jgi:TPP-dependent indolepyruvate ferredoxin oxidoreductase alpha subunit
MIVSCVLVIALWDAIDDSDSFVKLEELTLISSNVKMFQPRNECSIVYDSIGQSFESSEKVKVRVRVRVRGPAQHSRLTFTFEL